jgi:lysophospholipase L1-like esterase
MPRNLANNDNRVQTMVKRQTGKNLIVLAVSIAFCLVVAELVLRFVFPIRVVTIGLQDAPKADRYGWALKPHQLIRILDPDTGAVYTDYANSEGWRDRERTIERRPNTLRILVIGDSVTYGAIVGQADTYTAILERKLQANGVNAEVINISYGGWGTDQELEALTLEGVSYKPDLVILQFTTNDPADNSYFASDDEETRRLKPFYYELDASGALQRHVNPLFKTDLPPVTLYDRARNLAKHIEILRTPIMLYRAYQMRASSGVTAARADGVRSRPQYSIKAGRIEHVKLALHMDESAPLVQALRKAIDTSPSEESLIAMIDRAGQSGNREAILRMLNGIWNNLSFYPKEFTEARHFDPASPLWRLQDAVTTRFIQVAQQSGAKVALFNSSEAGAYAWEAGWYRVEDTPRNRELYLSHVKLLAEIAKRENAWMIPNRRALEAAHNNLHPNARGNQVIADDIYDFLREDAKLIP